MSGGLEGGLEREVEKRSALSLEEGDLREYLRVLPTRNDMEAFAQHLEQGYHKELQSVKMELRATGVKTVELEQSLDILTGSLQITSTTFRYTRGAHPYIVPIIGGPGKS